MNKFISSLIRILRAKTAMMLKAGDKSLARFKGPKVPIKFNGHANKFDIKTFRLKYGTSYATSIYYWTGS